MRDVLYGLTVFMIFNLTACGSLTVQGNVIPAAEATKRQSTILLPEVLQLVDRTQGGMATPTPTPAGLGTQEADISLIGTPTPTPAAMGAQSTGMPVIGWAGYVIGLPAGSEFDDKVDIWADDAGELGIKGADEATEARIISLRDTQQEAHFWGRLTCNVADFNDCQLLVERMVITGVDAFPSADAVDGWTGTIVGNPPGAQFNDYFLLADDGPIHYKYGIESAFSSSDGELGLADQIAALRNSGKTIHIWGELVCGAIDVGGCQIAVRKIDVDGTIHEVVPVTLVPDR